MHYYQFSIGDYRAATAHLSNDEDLAYRRLLDMYYDTEKKIPLDTQWVARRLRLDFKTVNAVLVDMFEKQEDGWFHARCQEVIEHYHAMAEKNRANGKLGGRRKNPVGNPVGSDSEPSAKATNNQEPINQEPSITVSKDTVRPPTGEPEVEKVQKLPGCDHKGVLALYHSILPNLPTIEIWNDTRAGYLRQRWREVALDLSKDGSVTHDDVLAWWKQFFEHIKGSKFLTGRTQSKDKPPFLADLEWVIKPTNFAKIIEGKYHRD
jgi:uncharacterized protein YdaU (DUF1376 family)